MLFGMSKATHPGDTLFAMLKERDLGQRELAREMGISPTFINDLVACRRKFGIAISLRLEKALGHPAEFWMVQQMNFDLARARRR